MSAVPWRRPLDALGLELQKAHGDDWAWTRGGCFAFAEHFQTRYGGDLWCVCRLDAASGDFPAEHALVKLGESFYDADGVFDVTRLPDGSTLKPKSDDLVFWFDDEFLSDEQWDRLGKILSACEAPVASGSPKKPRRQTP